ncbi:MAG: hypothetical protein WC007_00665 [Pelobacteraceae bacterium]
MVARQIKSRFIVVAMIAVAVISLAFSAGAATIPVVSTLTPLEKGLQTPLKMALDANGDIYVADPRSGGVVQLDQYGAVKQTVSTPSVATAIAVLNPLVSNIPVGKLLIALGDRVVAFDQSGVEVAKIGSGAGQFVKASGIALDAAGSIYVTDTGAYCVKKFDSAGNLVKTFGVFGVPPSTGVFSQPTAIAMVAVTGGEQVAVVDTVNGNVQFFTTDGVYVKTVGASGGPGPLSFSYPVGIAFDFVSGVASRMYVLDAYQGYVQAVDVTVDPAVFLSNIGTYGFAGGQLLTPSDMVYDQVNKRLLVSNGMSNIVSFGIDGGSNPFNSTPPALSVSQSSLFVDVPSATISGTVEAGATLTSSVSATARTSAASFPSTSSWTISVSDLVPGVNTVSVTAANQYGVTTTKTVVVTYTPATVQLTLDSFAALTGQATAALTGTTEAGSVVTVYNAATKISGQANVIDGVWTFAATLVEGANALTVTSSKTAKASARKDVVIELDTLAPVINASLLLDGSVSSTQVLSVSGTVADAHIASCTINGTPAVLTNGQFSSAVALNLGANTVTIAAVDQLGNTTTDARTITFNPSLPQITVQSPVDGLITNTQDVVVDVTADVASVLINGNAALPGAQSGSFAATVKLVAGLNTIFINATDQFGRVIQEKRTVTYDAAAPVVTITSPSQDVATKNPGVTISGLISDSTAISSIRATVNGVDAPVTLTNDAFTVFAEMTQESAYTVAITVTDAAHNSSTAYRTLLYDVTPPVVAVNPVFSALPVALSGTVEQGATVVVSDSGSLKVQALVNGTAWTSSLTGVTYDVATLTVTATDAAGNASVKSISVSPPDGDVDADGTITIRDALRVIKLVVSNAQPTQQDLEHGDIGPLLGGKRNPNGKLDLVDGILILRKALGLSAWL